MWHMGEVSSWDFLWIGAGSIGVQTGNTQETMETGLSLFWFFPHAVSQQGYSLYLLFHPLAFHEYCQPIAFRRGPRAQSVSIAAMLATI